MKHYHLIVFGIFITVVLSPFFCLSQKISDVKQAYAARDYETTCRLAVQVLESSGLSDADKGQLHYYIGISRRYQGRYSEAFLYYEKALNTYPSDDKKAQVLLNMGALMALLNQHQEAIRIYTRSIRLSEAWAYSGYYNRALSYKAAGELPEAVKDLYASLRSCEDQGYELAVSRVYNQLGLIELGTGRLPEARDYFFRTINNDPDTTFSGVAWHNIALTDLKAGDTLSAIASYQHAIPLHRSADQLFLTYYDLCELYITLEREKSPSLKGGAQRAGDFYHLADSLYRSGVTINDTSLKLFFRGMDLGLATHHDLEDEFAMYTAEKNRTMEAYQAYTGTLLLQQIADRQRLLQERYIKYGITLLFGLAAALTSLWWYRKRLAIKRDVIRINREFKV